MKTMNHFPIGGTVEPNNKFYVFRQADRDIIRLINKSEYSFVLNSRQMGKSSLMTKTHVLLKEKNVSCSIIDLSSFGSFDVTAEQWYKTFAYYILESLELDTEIDLDEWWEKYSYIASSTILDLFLKDVLFTRIDGKIHIFIDEIDSIIHLPFKDDVFALIRACYNKRAIDKEYERLTFCLIGVATPSDLIQDRTRTPFNIGTPIELTGFTFKEAKNALVDGLKGLEEQPEKLLEEILEWTGGQPFLTQKLCQLVVDNYEANNCSVEQIVQKHIIDNWETQDNPQHFRTIKDRLLSQESKVVSLLGTYQQVLNAEETSQKVTYDRSEIIDTLRLSGIVVNRNNCLEVYNPIYREIFNRDWVRQQLDELRPYSEQINQWLENDKDSKYLLEGKALQAALQWSSKRSIGDLDREYLQVSERKQNRQKFLKIAFIFSAIAIVIGIVSGLYAKEKLRESKISQLENEGNQIAVEFERDQISGLITGIETSDRLQNIMSKQSQTLTAYPTYSPIDNLYSVIDKINQQNILEGHTGDVQKVAFSPDGKIIASASYDKTIKLWDANTQQELKTLAGHEKVVEVIDFSPDGKYLVSGDRDGNLLLWNIKFSNNQLPNNLKPQKIDGEQYNNSGIAALDFSPDSQQIAVSFYDGKIRIWNVADFAGEPVIVKDDYQSTIYALNYSPSGENLVLGDNSGNLTIWNLENNSNLVKPRSHNAGINELTYSPDGQKIVSSSSDGTIKLWNSQGQHLDTYDSQAKNEATVAFSPDSKIIAVGNSNGKIELWDVGDRPFNFVKSFIHSEGKAVNSLSFSPNGNTLVSGGDYGTIQLWQLNNNSIPQIKAHNGLVNSLSISQDNNLLVSGGNDGKIVLWQPTANAQATNQNLSSETSQSSSVNSDRYQPVKEIKCDPSIVNSVSINPIDSNFIACGGVKGIKVYNRQDNSFQEVATEGEIDSLSYSPDGQTIMAGTDSGKLTLWNLDGTVKQEFVTDNSQDSLQSSTITKVLFGSDGQTIAVGRGNLVQIWNLDGKLTSTFKAHQDEVSSINFNSDGNLLVSGDKGGTVKLWDNQGNEIDSFSPPGNSAITDVAFSPDNKMIVGADESGKVNFWKIDRADRVNFMLAIEENSGVNSIRFANNGQTLITGNKDGSVAFWDLDLDSLIAKGCLWLRDYFTTHPDDKLDACE